MEEKQTNQLPVNSRAAGVAPGDARQEVQIQASSFLDKLKIHKFKILGGVLGVFVLVGAVLGAYKFGQKQVQPPGLVVTPTPLPSEAPAKEGDPTANWKTYTNTKYGFEIKYPPDLDWGKVAVAGENVNFGVHGCIFMEIKENSKNLGVEKFCEEELKEIYPSGIEEDETFHRSIPCWHILYKSPEKIIIGEKQAFQSKKIAGPLASTDTLISANNFIFEVGKIESDYLEYEGPCKSLNTDEIYDLMLSTFRFLPSTSSGQGE